MALLALTLLAVPPASVSAESAETKMFDPPAVPSGAIGQIVGHEPDFRSAKRYTYEPAGRRDPFRSLVEKVSMDLDGPRPNGIAGMLIAEVDLVGIVKDPQGDLAFFNGSDNRGYFLRKGDKLYDGTITRIDSRRGRVIFRQEVNDPRLIKPFREVMKNLNPGEEGNP
ncbi:MAG: hypothetical protein V3U98_12350 [Acidobacteriota bacterium]